MIDAFNPAQIWKPFSVFSMGAIQGDGRVVYLKGQIALDKDGAVVAKGDMREQTRKTLDNIRTVLAYVGGEMQDILAMTHHVTDIEAFMKTADIRRAFFAPPFPVTTTVQVVRLFHPDLVVEMTAIAEVPNDRFRPAHDGKGIR
jgi:enamine deaminase RidA (YjgF/YER057c/UK114 family)